MWLWPQLLADISYDVLILHHIYIHIWIEGSISNIESWFPNTATHVQLFSRTCIQDYLYDKTNSLYRPFAIHGSGHYRQVALYFNLPHFLIHVELDVIKVLFRRLISLSHCIFSCKNDPIESQYSFLSSRPRCLAALTGKRLNIMRG